MDIERFNCTETFLHATARDYDLDYSIVYQIKTMCSNQKEFYALLEDYITNDNKELN